MRYAIATMLTSLALAACAFDTRDSAFGQPVSIVVAQLGLPNEVVAGRGRRKVYIWSTNNFVDGTNCRCQFRATLDDKDIILFWHSDGSLGSCERLADKFPFKF